MSQAHVVFFMVAAVFYSRCYEGEHQRLAFHFAFAY